MRLPTPAPAQAGRLTKEQLRCRASSPLPIATIPAPPHPTPSTWDRWYLRLPNTSFSPTLPAAVWCTQVRGTRQRGNSATTCPPRSRAAVHRHHLAACPATPRPACPITCPPAQSQVRSPRSHGYAREPSFRKTHGQAGGQNQPLATRACTGWQSCGGGGVRAHAAMQPAHQHRGLQSEATRATLNQCTGRGVSLQATHPRDTILCCRLRAAGISSPHGAMLSPSAKSGISTPRSVRAPVPHVPHVAPPPRWRAKRKARVRVRHPNPQSCCNAAADTAEGGHTAATLPIS